MNFQTNDGQKVTLTGAEKVRDTSTVNRLTDGGRPRSVTLKNMVIWLTIWFRVMTICRRFTEPSLKFYGRQAFG